MGDSQKKIVVAGVASILLVAAVVAIVVSTNKSGGAAQAPPAGVNKAVQAICAPTNYKETCEKSLAQANTTDPKELLKLAFDAAILNISDVLNNSPLLKEAVTNPTLKGVYSVCQQVLETAINDLKRSIEHMDVLEARKANEYVMDIRTWLTAVIANQETCIDTFAERSTEMSKEMRTALLTARELSSNVLAMMSDSASMLAMFKVDGGRMLLTEEPEFAKRRLFQARIFYKPNIVVAQDGSGNFNTIGAAIASLVATKKGNASAVIYVKAGLYNEQVTIPSNLHYVTLVGDGPTKTIITGKRSVGLGKADYITTYNSTTVAVEGWHFLAKDIAFENTAGPQGHQAVALRVTGDEAIFFNVVLNGYQDTLYAHIYRQYYRDCSISGTIDFVFGQSFAFFQNCKFIVRKPDNNQACMVTADGRLDPNGVDGIVIQNGNITAEPALLATNPPIKAYLGRPWKEYATTIIMQSNIDGFIDPTGWAPWNASSYALDTCFYAEYMNRGAGSNTANRVQWKGIRKLTPQLAQGWTGGSRFQGDEWIRESGVPYVPTLM